MNTRFPGSPTRPAHIAGTHLPSAADAAFSSLIKYSLYPPRGSPQFLPERPNSRGIILEFQIRTRIFDVSRRARHILLPVNSSRRISRRERVFYRNTRPFIYLTEHKRATSVLSIILVSILTICYLAVIYIRCGRGKGTINFQTLVFELYFIALLRPKY